MIRRLVAGAFASALLVVATGCSEECVDQFDCEGSPGENKRWTCVENKCKAEDVSVTPPTTDAGTQTDAGTDAGTQTDAGTDAGTQTDAGTDAGVPPPADMSLAEGATCEASVKCMAGLYCDGTKKCAPLHVMMTTTSTTTPGSEAAVIVYYKQPGGDASAPMGTPSPTKLSEAASGKSRFPQWSKDGKTAAFVEEDTGGAVALVSRALPLVAGSTTTVITGANAGTQDFRYMEWEPSSTIAWTTKTSTSTSGVSGITPGGSLQNLTSSGVFPSWAADGLSFAYSANTLGLKVHSASGEGTVSGVSSTTAEQPLYNKANGVVLYLDAKNATETISGEPTPLTELFTPVVAPATTPTEIALASTDNGTPTAVKSFIANHTWSPLGTHVAYVRVYYAKPLTGDATLCQGGSTCGGQNGNVIFVRRIDTSGKPVGAEIQFATEATLPSFSPDGRFLAYLSGGKLQVQQLNPDGTDAASLKVGPLITHNWGDTTRVVSNKGDDNRPRWQPR